jgi:hypothetical protein
MQINNPVTQFKCAISTFSNFQGLFKMIANDKSSEDYVQLHKMLFNPFGLYESGYIDKTVRGATRTQMSKPRNSMSSEVLKIAIFLLQKCVN